MALTEGTTIGPYEVVGLIGKGGMGEVYRARVQARRSDRMSSVQRNFAEPL